MTRFFAPWFVCLMLPAQEQHRLEIEPLDFQTGQTEFYIPGINQLEAVNNKIFLRGNKHTEIVVISPRGEILQRIGGKGGHPAEFGDLGVMAMAVEGDRIWGIDSQLKSVRLFVEGRLITFFALESFNAFFHIPTSNVFAASGQAVVIPAHPSSGFLAKAYSTDGKHIRDVGELLPFEKKLTRLVPGMNDTFWLADRHSYYSIHKLFSHVNRYDQDFKVLNQFAPTTPTIAKLVEDVLDFMPNKHFNTPTPVFTDAKLHRGKLWLMSGGKLHRVNLKNGEVETIYTFYGAGPEFKHKEHPVSLFSFAFFAKDQLVLAHPAMLWGHDLWTAQLPAEGGRVPKPNTGER